MLLSTHHYANHFGMAVMTIMGLVFSLGALTTIYSQNTFAQNSNTDSVNGGISGAGGAYTSANSGAGGASSGTGGYRSNGGFALGGVLHKGGSGGAIIGGGSTGTTGQNNHLSLFGVLALGLPK